MTVTCKRKYKGDPNSGSYVLTREDGLTIDLHRSPSGWLFGKDWSNPYATKTAAVVAFSKMPKHDAALLA